MEVYQGARTASGITDEVVNKINNHVAKLTDKDVNDFVAKEGPKALLFTEKGTTSALLRSIAIDFLDVIKVGQIRNKEKAAVERFGIERFPTLVLIPAGADAKPIVYDGELKKKDMVEFLKQAGEPNSGPAPSKGKDDKKKEKKPKEEKPKASESKSEEATKSESSSTSTTPPPTASTSVTINSISSDEMLQENCLQPNSRTCVLAIVPSEASEKADQAVDSLSRLNAKYIQGNRKLFPLYSLPDPIASEAGLRGAFELTGEVELVAINVRKGWWRHYKGDFGPKSVEAWIDQIRMGEGDKKTLDILFEKTAGETPVKVTPVTKGSSKETKAPEAETEAPKEGKDEKIAHEEL